MPRRVRARGRWSREWVCAARPGRASSGPLDRRIGPRIPRSHDVGRVPTARGNRPPAGHLLFDGDGRRAQAACANRIPGEMTISNPLAPVLAIAIAALAAGGLYYSHTIAPLQREGDRLTHELADLTARTEAARKSFEETLALEHASAEALVETSKLEQE